MESETTVIVGGGAAGFFAAIHVAEARPRDRVVILERGKSVLDKVRISGGGRCNVTHACWDPRELIRYYPRGGTELLGPFHKFACGDTMAWFEDRGVALKIEDDGRVFPESDTSASIVGCLERQAKRSGVQVVTGTRVTGCTAPAPRRQHWTVHTSGGDVQADRLVVTSGSNPAVWDWLAALGHTIVPPVPSLFAFNVPETELRQLAGISVPWARVTLSDPVLTAEGPLLITHKGLSGPAVLRLSAWGARELHPLTYNFPASVNWVNVREEDAVEELKSARQERSRQLVATRSLYNLPQRLWLYLLRRSNIDGQRQWAQLSNAESLALARALVASEHRVTGKATNKDEFTTAGGIALAEVDFRGFQSKLYSTLFLAGEVLDVDAITGGFNFQAAWTGGFLIGEAVKTVP